MGALFARSLARPTTIRIDRFSASFSLSLSVSRALARSLFLYLSFAIFFNPYLRNAHLQESYYL